MPWVRFNPETFRGEEWEGPRKPDAEIEPKTALSGAVAGFSDFCHICQVGSSKEGAKNEARSNLRTN